MRALVLRFSIVISGSVLSSLALSACDTPAPAVDSGALDGGPHDAASSPDASPSDAAAPDAGERDADGPDALAPIDGAAPDAEPPFDGGMPLELVRTALCGPLAHVLCTTPWDCACPDLPPRPTDPAACESEQATACVDSLATSEIGLALAAGHAVVDAGAIAVCAARLEASYAACSGTNRDFTTWCVRAFVDRAAIGATCRAGGAVPLCGAGEGACDGGGTCRALPDRGAPCADDGLGLCRPGLVCREGTCADPGMEGDACDLDAECAPGPLCVDRTCGAARVVLGGTCDATADCVAGARCEGAICAAVAASPSCTGDGDCPALSYCESRFEGRCVALGAIGSPCAAPEACVPEAFCDFASGVCAARPGSGEPCDTWCAAGLYCGDDGFCHPRSGLGSPCAPRPDTDGCEDGLTCIGSICQTLPDFGAPCEGECAGGLECLSDRTTGTTACGAARNLGEPCDGGWDGNDCTDGLFCDFAVSSACAPVRNLGEECSGASRDECVAGHECVFDEATRLSHCRPLPVLGELCSSSCVDSACVYAPADGRCVPTVCSELPAFGGGPRPGPGPTPPPLP